MNGSRTIDGSDEQSAERALRSKLLESIAVSVIVMIVSWLLLVAVILEHGRGSLR